MLNSNEKAILRSMQDTEFLEFINATPQDVEKAILMAKKEIEELESIVKKSQELGEGIADLSGKLNGHNEEFNEKFPNYNYFDLNFKSLLITVKQPLDSDNNSLPMEVSKSGVSIYPDNISKVVTDAIVELDFEQEINFEKIYKELGNQKEKMQEDENEM